MPNASQSFRVGKFAAVSLLSSLSSTTSPREQPPKDDKEHEWSQYEQLVRKLYMTNLFNPVKLGLENMDRLHELLGRPMDRVRLHNCIICNDQHYDVVSKIYLTQTQLYSQMYQ
jgi:hypothetical protein